MPANDKVMYFLVGVGSVNFVGERGQDILPENRPICIKKINKIPEFYMMFARKCLIFT